MTKAPCDNPGTLLVATLHLLKKDTRTVLEVYRDTGIPYYWLKKFAEGGTKNPSVNRVQALYEHLSGKTLSY